MTPIDWSAMTPREVWEALKSAPKVAGPWDENGYAGRLDASGRPPAWPMTSPSGRVFGYETVDGSEHMSRDSADAALRAAGWLLVDDDGITP